MNRHRLVALVSATVLVGLLGVAQASNFAAPSAKTAKSTATAALRAKVQSAKINGCGG